MTTPSTPFPGKPPAAASNAPSPAVFLVGAGPGDPGLLTLRAVECLEKADLVLYDYLVNPAVLEHASEAATLECLGRHGVGRMLSPEEIVDRMLQEAQNGRIVVRLKGGDPSVFARGADERSALREAQIPFEIVPGITAGLAAAGYCEIPVTHHDDASAVALIAGQERHCKEASSLDYQALAGFPGTLIFYMGVTKVAGWSRALVEHGRPPDTPVAIVRWCSRARQETSRCTLQSLPDTVDSLGLRPPALFVVGKVVARAPELSWFASRPLFGTRILATGSRATSRRLRDQLVALGAQVVEQPTVRLADPVDWAPVDAALARLDRYEWLVLVGAAAVDSLIRRLRHGGADLRRLGRVKLAAVGSHAAERLARYHLQADLVAESTFDGPGARALSEATAGSQLLLARPSWDHEEAANKLEMAGGKVERVVVCKIGPVAVPSDDALAAVSESKLDWITVTSSATARSLSHLFAEHLGRARLASIGPAASRALADVGLEPAVEAHEPTIPGLVDAILAAR